MRVRVRVRGRQGKAKLWEQERDELFILYCRLVELLIGIAKPP